MAIMFVQDVNEQSVKWYTEFIDHLPVGLCRTNFKGKITFCNRTLIKLLGYDNQRDLLDHPISKFCKNKEECEFLLSEIIEKGDAAELKMLFMNQSGFPISCSLESHATRRKDGSVSHLDFVIRKSTQERDQTGEAANRNGTVCISNDFSVVLDLEGGILDINDKGAKMLGFKKEELIKKPLIDFVVPGYRDPIALFLSALLKTGREEGILRIMDSRGKEHQLEFQALLPERNNNINRIELIAQDVTNRFQIRNTKMSEEKFSGVMEMAGGVAHKLNQPLTIINNLLSEILLDWETGDKNYQKIMKVHSQIQVLNSIAKKIGGIKKYESMDYVAGIKIVDIDKASLDNTAKVL